MFKFLRKTALYIFAVPMFTFLLGVASNQVVLIANHDKFPVMLNERKTVKYLAADKKEQEKPDDWKMPVFVRNDAVMIDDVHCIMDEQSHLKALADIFDFHTAIYSVGDGLIELGQWLMGFSMPVWMFEVVRRLRKQE